MLTPWLLAEQKVCSTTDHVNAVWLNVCALLRVLTHEMIFFNHYMCVVKSVLVFSSISLEVKDIIHKALL